MFRGKILGNFFHQDFLVSGIIIIFTYNIKTNSIMKTKTLETIFTVWAIGVGVMAFTGIVLAIFHIANGDITSTASFEF